ncbi:MAG: ATP-binding protein [Chloroflexi bacterium]|nr:ATP-binding protein [Chloroflexota bacterium]
MSDDQSEDFQPTIDRGQQEETPLGSLIGHLVEATGGEAAVLSLWEEQDKQPVQIAEFGLVEEDSSAARELVGSLASQLASIAAEKGVSPAAAMEMDNWTGKSGSPLHLLCFPVKSDGKTVGMLCLFHESAAPTFFSEHPGAYEVVVDQLKIVVENRGLIRRLMTEKQWLEAAIQYSTDGIMIVDSAGRVIAINSAAEKTIGVGIADAVGRSCSDVLAGLEGQKANCHCVFGSQDRNCGMDDILMTKIGGQSRYVQVMCRSIEHQEGRPLGGVVTLRDVTAQKMEEQLQRTFLSIISHELQSPISVIKGYTGLLEESGSGLSPEQMQKALNSISEESDRLSKLVEKLLYASRIQVGGLSLEIETLDLTALVRRVADRMNRVSPRHRVMTLVPEVLPPVRGDFERIQEVLTNLVENAIKYSPSGGEVHIEVEAFANEVTLSVEDEGIGVNDAEKEKIFQAFSRSDGSLARSVKGTGLGLYIAKAIVEAHGGRIWVEQAPHGARFRFTIPRTERANLPVVADPNMQLVVRRNGDE